MAASEVSAVFEEVGIECVWGGKTPGGFSKTTSAHIDEYGLEGWKITPSFIRSAQLRNLAIS